MELEINRTDKTTKCAECPPKFEKNSGEFCEARVPKPGKYVAPSPQKDLRISKFQNCGINKYIFMYSSWCNRL